MLYGRAYVMLKESFIRSTDVANKYPMIYIYIYMKVRK